MVLRRLVFLALLLVASAFPSRAWDEGGHEIIAAIAEAQLTPKALAMVDRLALELPPIPRPYNDITMACWMDDLRNHPSMPDHGRFLTWHYIDLGLQDSDPVPSFEPGDDNELHGNAVQALKRAMVVLQGGTDPYVKSKAIACAMVLHLVGDIHQPLHAATRYSVWHHRLEEDHGGNRESIDNGPPGYHRLSLHAFWDSAWRASVDGEGRVMLAEFHPREIASLAAELSRQPPAGANLDLSIEGWAQESNGVARSFVYPELGRPSRYYQLSGDYVEKANRLARQRLVLAAYRLAALLNRTLGANSPAAPPKAYPPGPAAY